MKFPYGLAVRIPGFHPGGPGSTPGMGITRQFFFYLFFFFAGPALITVFSKTDAVILVKYVLFLS